MIVTKTKRRTVITTVPVNKRERFMPIDIRIPSNAVMISGVLVTSSASWINCGVVTLQASDRMDVFHIAYIGSENIAISDEALMGIENEMPDHDKPWVTGKMPQLRPVQIDGDNIVIRAWFKGAEFQQPFTIRIYVEYEGAEEFIGVEPQRLPEEEKQEVFIL
jgi:hypothetical protein